MLLPPFNAQQLAAFNLTSFEKEMKRDVLFPPDLGIPINALDIEQYSVPSRGAAALDPRDEALLQDEGEAGGRVSHGLNTVKPAAHLQQRRNRREGASDVSWLMRTKYITNDFGAARRASGKAPRSESAQDLLPADDIEGQIAAIEKTFEAARKPPKHPKNPNATPLDILPILPDDLLEGWSCVQTNFDGNPGGDVEALAKLPPDQKARAMQAAQIKTFRKTNNTRENFSVFLLPAFLPEAAPSDANADGALAMTASQLAGDYKWVREYDNKIQYDDQGQTYLLRIGKDYVGYSDLNTKVNLRKRKRGLTTENGEEDEEEGTLPEKFIIGLLDDDQKEDNDDEQGALRTAPAVAAPVDDEAVARIKNVFGSDDDEEED